MQRQRLAADSLQAHLRAVQGRGVFGKLEAERHRQRMLQPGARHHDGRSMLARQFCKARDGAVDVAKQGIDARAQAQHPCGIDHVLAGRAPMHIARGLRVGFRDMGGQRFDQGNGEVARTRRGLGQASEIEGFGPAGLCDGLGRALRNHARRGLGVRQRRLEIEHMLEGRHVVADGAHRRAREHGGKQR